MSKVLDALKPGDSIDVRGPTGRFFYQGRGKLGFKTEKWQTEPSKFHDVKKIVMIAGTYVPVRGSRSWAEVSIALPPPPPSCSNPQPARKFDSSDVSFFQVALA